MISTAAGSPSSPPETIPIKTKRLMALCFFMSPGQPSQPRASASLPHKAASRMPSRVRSSQITTSCPTLTGIRVARMQGMEAEKKSTELTETTAAA